MTISDVQVNIGNLKVFQISGTSAFIIGKGVLSDFSSDSKTNNGVGNAYGDGSNIDMSPQNLRLNDPELIDTIAPVENNLIPPAEVPSQECKVPPLWGWVPHTQR